MGRASILIKRASTLAKAYLPESGYQRLRGLLRTPARAWDLGAERGAERRALISYVSDCLLPEKLENPTHTNVPECAEWVQVFLELGFRVDVLDFSDGRCQRALRGRRYEVIFGFGLPFLEAARQNPQARRIVYLTEPHPQYAREQDLRRIGEFERRHGRVSRKLIRSETPLFVEELPRSNAAVLIGNDETRKTLRDYPHPLALLTPTGLLNSNFRPRRDLAQSRRCFLWFGSRGAIRKGLDLAVEAFDALADCDLYLCGLHEGEALLLQRHRFWRERRNVHLCGFVPVRSEAFESLANRCSYTLLPSCVEGMSTSVLTCMRHGIIPIVSRESGVTLQDGMGSYLTDLSVPAVIDAVAKAAQLSEAELSRRHQEVSREANQVFTLERFHRDAKEKIAALL
jgi:glycosyltransferase involved in cell wall biosynthesis